MNKVTRSENVILNHGSAAHRPGAWAEGDDESDPDFEIPWFLW